MKDDIKKLIQSEMMEEAERIIEEVNADPALKDVEVPEGLHDKLFAQIRAYEEQKALEQLSEENMELIRLGKMYKKRRKWNGFLVLAVALVALLALGSVSIGEDETIFEAISRLFSGGEQEMVNSENIEPIVYLEEDEAYEKVEETYGFKPVKLEYLPENTTFYEAKFLAEIQSINMIYEMDDATSMLYVIRPNYRESSFGTVIEDEKIQGYQVVVDNVTVIMTEYYIKESGQNRWSVCFEYQDVQYLLRITNMEQEEVEEIVRGLHFWK